MSLARLVAGLLLFLACAGPAHADIPIVTYEGRAYVELVRVAEALRAGIELSPTRTQAYLRKSGVEVTVTQDWARVTVAGSPVVLDAPVRVKHDVWLVPRSFLTQVVPRLDSGTPPRAVAAPPPAPGGTLADLRFRSYPSFTRIVIETSSPLEARVESAGPKEARVRLTRLAAAARVEEIGDGFITQARLDPAGADMLLRVGFEGAPGELRVSTLADPDRLVLDFGRPAEPPTAGAVTPLRVVVLDAGHGGHDTGAVGPGGLMEKELVLDITRRVARLLEAKLDVKVLLTRDSDVFVPLRDRTSFANRERADLFVSIHANAHREAASEGVETYFLSSEATDSAARQVAAQENEAVQLEKPAGRARADVVRTILWDLAQSEYQHESSRLAEVVQDSMTRALRIPNRGVKQAGFYVLGGAAMPAVLIEVGFVTNPREARRLRDSRYRDEIAQAIFAGLAEYKRKWDARSRSAQDRPR